MDSWVSGDDAAKHLITFLALTVVLGGLVLGVLKGWKALIDEMREIVNAHAADEKKWAEENEQHASAFREEVLTRLDRVETDVQSIREHLISDGRIPLATTPPHGWPIKP